MQYPDAVVLYNQYMAAVNKGDQLQEYYRSWFLFHVARYNLSIFTPTTMPISHQHIKAFRLRLADQLVDSHKCLGHLCSLPAHPPPAISSLHHLGSLPAQVTRIALHLASFPASPPHACTLKREERKGGESLEYFITWVT